MRALRDRGAEHAENVKRGDDRRDAYRISADPGDRPIIIGGGYSEHAQINSRPSRRPTQFGGRAPKNFLEKPRKQGRFISSCDGRSTRLRRTRSTTVFMEDIAPA